MRRQLVDLFVVACFLFGSAARNYGVTFEGSGTVSNTVFDTAGKIVQERQRTFHVLVSSNTWWIRTEATAPPRAMSNADLDLLKKRGIIVAPGVEAYAGDDGGQVATECSSDGRALYIKSEIFKDSERIERKRKADPSYLGQPDELEIRDLALPTFTSELFFPVWLGFCAQSYIRAPEVYSPPLIWMNYGPQQNSRSARDFRLVPKFRGEIFIESLLFENQGVISARSKNGQVTVDKMQNGANAPFVEAAYRVEQWGRLGNVDYPELAYFDVYPLGKTNVPAKAVFHSTINVLVFRVLDQRLDGSPIVTNLVRVTDYRPSVDRPLRYYSTNGVAQPGEQRMANLMKKYANDLQPTEKHTITSRTKAMAIKTLLILSLIGAVAAFWVAVNKRQTN